MFLELSNIKYTPFYIRINKISILLTLFAISTSCKKLVEVNPPITSTTGSNVFTTDPNAISAVTTIYSKLSSGNTNYSFITGSYGLSLLAGLSADEFTLYSGVPTTDNKYAYYTNSLYVNGIGSINPGTEVWNPIYSTIYNCNASIEGLTNAISLTPAIKQQLLGEVKFMRAFCYFYLVNLYGDIPLLVSTDYKVNASASRTSISDVYQQIITDLIDAKNSLSDQYLDGSLLKTSSERVRPTKWTSAALMARAYLYLGDWSKAEEQATEVINNSSLFSLDTLNGAFKKNSKEAIWQLQPVNSGWNTEDAKIFIVPSTGPNNNTNGQPVYLSSNLLTSFETGDQRKKKWVDSVVTTGGKVYYYSSKYKSNTFNASVTEYLMILRLAEQYLIRAEARAQQGNINGSQADLNIIRTRAGLINTSATDKSSLQSAILHERQVELFTELGQRWFDMKRTGTINTIMSSASVIKGGKWDNFKQWYPLPFYDLQTDPNLIQNTGY